MSLYLKIFFAGITVIFITGKSSFSQEQTCRFRHLTSEDGLPSNWTLQVIKDTHGFIWVSSRAGICRYDGYNMKVFQYNPEDSTTISDNTIVTKDCMLEDRKGNLWIGTLNGLNRFNPVTEKFTRFKHNPDQPGSISSNRIMCIYEDKEGIIWIGTRRAGGLNMFNESDNSFIAFKPESSDNTYDFPNILAIFEDSRDTFWIGTGNGLYIFDRLNKSFSRVPVDSMSLIGSEHLICRSVHEDTDGTIYIGTQHGFLTYDNSAQNLIPNKSLFHPNIEIEATDFLPDNSGTGFTHWIISAAGFYRFNKNTSEVFRIKPDPEDPFSISGNFLKSIFRDKSGILWIPGEFGVNILDIERNAIRNFPAGEEEYNDATCFLEDRKGHFWIAAKDLSCYDKNMNLIKRYPFIIKNPGKINFTGACLSLLEDKESNVWIGKDNNGLYLLKNDAESFVPCTFSSPDINFIWDIFEDSSGGLWIGTNKGLFYRKPGDQPITHFYHDTLWGLLNRSTVLDIDQDREKNLWISTTGNGLFFQAAENRGSGVFQQYSHDPADSNSISSNLVWGTQQDQEGNLWIATASGLNKKLEHENRFIKFYNREDPGTNFIYDLTTDNRGFIWLLTENGLIRFDPGLKSNNKPGDGNFRQILPFKDIFPYRIYKDKKGVIYLGGAYNSGKGYYSFHPDSLKENRILPPVVIVNFKILDKTPETDTGITYKKHFRLNFNQNTFSFEFAALDYMDPAKNQYAYKLKGYDIDWIYSGTRRYANYTKVPPGNYIFNVKGSNNDGYWNETGTSIALTIYPPPWKTWWAYLIYSFLAAGLVFIFFRIYINRLKLVYRLELEQMEATKLRELDKMKSRFFANISHEFRTPLALILGPLDKMSTSVANDLKHDIRLMKQNAHRLLRLINQLLMLSRIEAGQMTLHLAQVDLLAVIKGYVGQFESLASQRKIDLRFIADKAEIITCTDQEKLETILYNLISNAFKFTPNGGKIVVEVDEKNDSAVGTLIIIKVSDTGTGIDKGDLERIFDRFYQADDHTSGTGIGLALTKELVEMLSGSISVESELNKGSTFTITLPATYDHQIAEKVSRKDEHEYFNELTFTRSNWHDEKADEFLQVKTGAESLKEEEKPLVLIVEDNEDLREYMRRSYAEFFRIIEAPEGEKGLEMALKFIPDLVISDVMMPKMDGYQLCQRLKSDERTSHIPVIMLTAKAGKENRIEGLTSGADDFIIKPFDAEELKIRITNLIRSRIALRKKYSLEIGLERKDSGTEILSLDQKFILRAKNIVLENLAVSDFSIISFANKMDVSRVQLHRKLKALVDQSATEFIRSIRLNVAAEQLLSGTGSISEIAYDVGFNTLSYFTRCFREKFHETPTEFIRNHSKK